MFLFFHFAVITSALVSFDETEFEKMEKKLNLTEEIKEKFEIMLRTNYNESYAGRNMSGYYEFCAYGQ